MKTEKKNRTITYWDRVKALAWALKGDGCSGGAPDLNYRPCCDRHDIHYKTGFDLDGTRITRKQADGMFFDCMKEHGKVPILGTLILPFLYWGAVRLFGETAWDKDKPFYSPPNETT